MNKIENLNDLLIEQSQELYDALKQEQTELPIIQKNAKNHALKYVIEKELNTSKKQEELLQETLDKLHATTEGKHNQCCSSILKTTHSMISRSKDAEVRDAAIINGMQRLNHEKVTGFGTLSAYLREIGEADLAFKHHGFVEQERYIDEQLTVLAEKKINRKAIRLMAGSTRNKLMFNTKTKYYDTY